MPGLPEALTAPSFLRGREGWLLKFSCNSGPSVNCAFILKYVLIIMDSVPVVLKCFSRDYRCPFLKFLELVSEGAITEMSMGDRKKIGPETQAELNIFVNIWY